MKVNSLTIRRGGEVNWCVTGDHHCGPQSEVKDGKLPVRYSITADCTTQLDPSGLLFDQAKVQGWMEGRAKKCTPQSCELLAESVGRAFLAHIKKTAPTCHVENLVVSLSPSPYVAEISARFQ